MGKIRLDAFGYDGYSTPNKEAISVAAVEKNNLLLRLKMVTGNPPVIPIKIQLSIFTYDDRPGKSIPLINQSNLPRSIILIIWYSLLLIIFWKHVRTYFLRHFDYFDKKIAVRQNVPKKVRFEEFLIYRVVLAKSRELKNHVRSPTPFQKKKKIHIILCNTFTSPSRN